jgi:hypothetical protein
MPFFRYGTIVCFSLLLWSTACAGEAPGPGGAFAAAVVGYRPAPGQFLNRYSDPQAALGAPDGSLVSLGGFGGSLTLRLDQPLAADGTLVVWGNAFYMGGDPRRRWAEPAVIEVSADATNWFLVGGSLVTPANPPHALVRSVVRTNTNAATWPAWAAGEETATFTALDLKTAFLKRVDPAAGYCHTNAAEETVETLYGYADCTPPGARPGNGPWQADDPFAFGADGIGGDTIRLAWLIDEAGFPVDKTVRALSFQYVRLTAAVDVVYPGVGESSPEIDAVGVLW